MFSPDYAEVTAAFTAGYADADERQRWGMANPGMGIACGWEPDVHPSGPPVGLGYQNGPPEIPVFIADSPAMAPGRCRFPSRSTWVPVRR